jgi:hypothetical protein
VAPEEKKKKWGFWGKRAGLDHIIPPIEEGLKHLEEEIGKTAAETKERDAELTSRIEGLGTRMDELGNKLDSTSKEFTSRIEGLDNKLGTRIRELRDILSTKIDKRFDEASNKTAEIEKRLETRVGKLEESLKDASTLVKSLSALKSDMDGILSNLRETATEVKAVPLVSEEAVRPIKPAVRVPVETVVTSIASSKVQVRGTIVMGIAARKAALERWASQRASNVKVDESSVSWAYTDEAISQLNQAVFEDGKLAKIVFDWAPHREGELQADKLVIGRLRLLIGMFKTANVFEERIGYRRAWTSHGIPWVVNWAVQQGAKTKREIEQVIRERLSGIDVRGVWKTTRRRTRFQRDYLGDALNRPELCGIKKVDDDCYELEKKLIEFEVIEREEAKTETETGEKPKKSNGEILVCSNRETSSG